MPTRLEPRRGAQGVTLTLGLTLNPYMHSLFVFFDADGVQNGFRDSPSTPCSPLQKRRTESCRSKRPRVIHIICFVFWTQMACKMASEILHPRRVHPFQKGGQESAAANAPPNNTLLAITALAFSDPACLAPSKVPLEHQKKSSSSDSRFRRKLSGTGSPRAQQSARLSS